MSRIIKGALGPLVILLLAGPSLWALDIDLSKIKVDGSIELKGQAANNETDLNDSLNDERNVTRHRLTLGVGGQLTEGVSARVEAVRKPTGVVSQFGAAAQTAHGEQANLTLENAFLSIDDVIWGIGAKIGRMYWGSKNSLVGFAGHWDDDNLSTMGVDAVTLHHKCGPVDVNYTQATLGDTKGLGGTDPGFARTALKSLGATINLKDVSGNDKVDVPIGLTIHHAASDGATGAAGNDVNLGVYELNVGANLLDNMLKLGLDWGSDFGQRNAAGVATTTPIQKVKFKGTLVSLRGAFNHEDSGFGINAEIANASGDDNTGEPDTTASQQGTDDKSWHDLSAFGLTPYKHYGEILGKSNTLAGTFGGASLLGLDSGSPLAAGAAGQGRGYNVLAIGVTYKPPVMEKKWQFGLDYITAKLAKLRPTASPTNTGLTASATDASTLTKDIGTEVDLSVSYMKSENVAFKLGYAQFDPESKSAVLQAATGATQDKATKLFANAGVRF